MSETRPGQPEINKRHATIIDKLAEKAALHVEGSDNLVILPWEQVDLRWHLEGTPLDYRQIGEVAGNADPRFIPMQARVDEAAHEADKLSARSRPRREMNPLRQAAQHLESGGNVILATNHGELTDIALVFAAVCNWLGRNGYEHLLAKSSNVRRALVASQITSVVGVKIRNPEAKENEPQEGVVPVPLALTMLVDHLLKSYPNKPSVAAIRHTWEVETSWDNKQVRDFTKAMLKTGGLFLAMAPSGSKDKPVPGDPDTYQLQPLTYGTSEWMKYPKTYVLFMGVWLQGKEPIIHFSGMEAAPQSSRLPWRRSRRGIWLPDGLVRIETENQAHIEMAKFGVGLSQKIPGKRFIYLTPDKDGDKNLVRKGY